MGGGAPKQPNYDQQAIQGVYADLDTYPGRAIIDNAARMGTTATVDGKNYDFTGLGDADNAAVMSDKMAQTLLAIQQNQGPEFIKQKLAELQEADPQGYAARQQLFDQIMQQATAAPNRPMASDLQDSINAELNNAGRLDSRETQQTQQATRGGQVARGNYLGDASTAQEAGDLVAASEAKRDAQQQDALGFQQAGISPDDVNYRRMQQSLGNLAAFQNGQTPAAQFASLDASGQGAAPFITGPASTVSMNMNAGPQNAQNSLGIYQGQVNWARSQANPYLAGTSTLLSGFKTLYNGGAFNPSSYTGTYAAAPTMDQWGSPTYAATPTAYSPAYQDAAYMGGGEPAYNPTATSPWE